MKFENIKIGDTVFIEESVSYGWSNSESFFIPKTVTALTKTQFVVGDIRISKQDGSIIGDRFNRAYFLGETGSFGKPIYDQTKEMQEFKTKLSIEIRIEKTIQSLKMKRNSGMSIECLTQIRNDLESICCRLTKDETDKSTVKNR